MTGYCLGKGLITYRGLTPNVVQAIHEKVLRSDLTSTLTNSQVEIVYSWRTDTDWWLS